MVSIGYDGLERCITSSADSTTRGLPHFERLLNDDGKSSVTLLDVSYDPTREIYADINAAFATAVHGAILCMARAVGELGAASVVSGHIRGETNTVPLHVEILASRLGVARGAEMHVSIRTARIFTD